MATPLKLEEVPVRPTVTESTVAQLVESRYGLRVSSMRECESYYDRNFHVAVESSTDNPHIKEVCPHGYILKVFNARDSSDFQPHVEAQHEVQDLLAKAGVNVPVPVLNVRGQRLSRERIYKDGTLVATGDAPFEMLLVRLCTFVPGIQLISIPYTGQILYDVGKCLGRMQKAVGDFHRPILESIRVDMKLIPCLTRCLHLVPDAEHRALAVKVLKTFEDVVVATSDRLPKGWCHNDLTEQNVLVTKKESVSSSSVSAAPVGPTQAEYSVSGVIDFGDMVFSSRVFDIAICMAQIMSDCLVNALSMVDPIDCGGHILAGYSSEIELEAQEWDVLKDCVEGRLVQTAVWGYLSSQEEDEFSDYVLQFGDKSWKLCQMTSQMSTAQLYERWKTVIQSHKKLTSSAGH